MRKAAYFLGFSLLSIVLFSIGPVQAQNIEAVVAGVSDPKNANIGDEVSIRCRVIGENGTELQQLPSGEPVSALGLQLTIDENQSPEGGFEGEIQGASGEGELTKSGLYVFRCRASDENLADNLGNRPGVIRATAPIVKLVSVLLRSKGDFRPRSNFEIDETILLQYRAFSDSKRKNIIRTSGTQVLIRTGHVGCNSGEEEASEDFNAGRTDEWTEGEGIIERYVPQSTGAYTFIVNIPGGEDGNVICKSAQFSVKHDARAPVVEIENPDSRVQRWDRDTLPIRGNITDNGTESPENFQVTVSNDFWSAEANVSDIPEGEDHFFFNVPLPWQPGLQTIEVTVEDAAGNVGRAVKSVYVGNDWGTISTDEPTVNTVHNTVLQPGRSLVYNSQGPIDSFHEIVALGPLLLNSRENLKLPGPTIINREVSASASSVLKLLITPDFEEVKGIVIPGQPEFQLLNDGDALRFVGRLPMTGRVQMDCGSALTDPWNRAICAVGGAPDGTFTVDIGGFVDAELRLHPTISGGLGVETDFAQDLEIKDQLSISNGIGSDGVNNKFSNEITSKVKENVKNVILKLWGCTDSSGNMRDFCTEPSPFEGGASGTPAMDHLPRPAWIRLFGGELQHSISLTASHPTPTVGTMNVTIPFRIGNLEMRDSRLDAKLSTGFHFGPTSDQLQTRQYLLDYGTLESEARPPESPSLVSWFGSGNKDLQGAVHLNAVNEALAHLWASELQQISLPLSEVLERGDFFSNGKASAVAPAIFTDARMNIHIQAPPRITYYDGVKEPFLELGAVKVELDLTENYNSKLVLETSLISKVDLSATSDGEGIEVAPSDPTGCEPDGQTFMRCNGRFHLEVVKREGFHEWTPRHPRMKSFDDLVNGDPMELFLEAVGAKDDEGEYRTKREFEKYYEQKMASVVSSLVEDAYTLELPNIPLPKFSFGSIAISPIQLKNLRIHERADGGSLSSGWIGFELDMEGETHSQ